MLNEKIMEYKYPLRSLTSNLLILLISLGLIISSIRLIKTRFTSVASIVQ